MFMSVTAQQTSPGNILDLDKSELSSISTAKTCIMVFIIVQLFIHAHVAYRII